MYLILYKIKCQQLYVHFGQPISDILPIDFSQKILYSSLYIFFVSFRYPPKEKLSGQLLVVKYFKLASNYQRPELIPDPAVYAKLVVTTAT